MAFGRKKERWYWCQEHERAERRGEACARDRRLGPYDSREAAENWKARHEAREEAWQDQAESWEHAGEPDDDEADG